MPGIGNLFSSDSNTSQPVTTSTGGAQAAGSAQAQGGNHNYVNSGTIQKDSSKNSHNTNNSNNVSVGNSTVTVKGAGSINYTTTTNGLTGDDLVAFENQIAGSLNSGNSGGGGSSTGFEFGNPSPTTGQEAIAATGSNIKWAIGAAIAFGLALAVYLFTNRKK